MASSPDEVNAFLDRVVTRLKPKRDEDYTSRVTYAAGAFNWRVQTGDQTRVVEYTAGGESLAAESDAHELTWSKSTPVSAAQIKA